MLSKGQSLGLASVDKVIHSPVRLAVVAALHSGGEESFSNLKKVAGTTDGNLTIHMKVLEENGIVSVRKRFVRRRPLTTYRLTRKGRQAFRDYVGCMARMVEQHSALYGAASGA
jgi:DNA-binding transcriptional ArsR family regulator